MPAPSKAIIAQGQTTIIDLNDPISSSVEPIKKVLDMLWLDTSVSPAVLKRWNGTAWEKPNDNANDIVDAVEKITTEYNAAINQTKKDINLKVEEVKTITDTQSRLMSSLQNEMELTKDATSFIKTKIEEVANIVDGKMDTVSIKEWARFDGSSLELGASNSIFKAILTNTELGFYQSDTKVAWISNNELQILSANIKQALTIGKAKFEWSDIYGLTIRW